MAQPAIAYKAVLPGGGVAYPNTLSDCAEHLAFDRAGRIVARVSLTRDRELTQAEASEIVRIATELLTKEEG